MAQDDPASGIENWERKFWSLGGLLKGSTPKKTEAKQDDSWHDEMVKEANDSFRKQVGRRLTSEGPKLASGKKKRTAKRKTQTARKR